MLVEVQALVSPTSFGTPRRMSLGLDANRTSLLLAVLEKRVGLELLGDDVFVSVAGGLDVDEPAADLGRGGGGGLVLPQPAAAPRTRWCSARWAWRARCAASASRACACARPRRWASRAASCPPATCPPDVPRASSWSASQTLEEALERLLDG